MKGKQLRIVGVFLVIGLAAGLLPGLAACSSKKTSTTSTTTNAAVFTTTATQTTTTAAPLAKTTAAFPYQGSAAATGPARLPSMAKLTISAAR